MRETVGEWSIAAYTFLLPFAWIAVAIVVLVLLPMSFATRTRSAAGTGLFVASYLFGATTWFLGAGITLSTFGWFGLIIGLLLFGVGVVPMAIFAAVFQLGLPSMALSLVVMSVVTIGSRMAGTMLFASAAEKNSQHNA